MLEEIKKISLLIGPKVVYLQIIDEKFCHKIYKHKKTCIQYISRITFPLISPLQLYEEKL